MIATLEHIEDNELFISWLANVLEKNGAKTMAEKNRYLYALTGDDAYCESQRKFRRDYATNIERLCHMEKDSALFPKADVILQKHTDLYAMMPFWSKGTQARRFEYNLHGLDSGSGASRGGLKQMPQKICPLCAREDFENHDRLVVHVPHMLHVDACWKHGCRLVDADEWTDDMADAEPIPATEHEIQMAGFMHDLYLDPAVTYFEQMRNALKTSLKKAGISPQKAIKQATEDGYLDPKLHTSLFLKEGYDDSENYCRVYLAVLTWYYKTADKFKADLPVWNPAEEYDRDEDMEMLSCNGPLARFRCRTCGHEFYMHPVSAEYGTPCPSCKRKMTDVQVMQRYADHLDDGQYDITKDESGRIHVIHRECGKDCTDRFGRIIWSHIRCEHCRVKHEVENHIGEKSVTTAGENIEIIGGKSMTDLTLKFDNGDTVSGKSYQSFLRGTVKGRIDRRLKKEREGLETVNRWGDHMRVLEYRCSHSISVIFDDGSIARNRNFASFMNGSIRKPKEDLNDTDDGADCG